MMNYVQAASVAAAPPRIGAPTRLTVTRLRFKRVFDVGFSLAVICLILVWLIPLIGLLIRLESPGPIFFRQTRWGKGKRRFQCYKFRSMRHNVSDFRTDGRFRQAEKNDERITRIGAFLRKTNLDELPQFWNVLTGDMSVVGPRPHADKHNQQLEKEIPYYNMRHAVKPGVTGLAQVTGYRGEASELEMMEKRVKLDLYYIQHASFRFDAKIIWWTITKTFRGDEKAY
jgi:putative colanic acid biosynthesis UDP-glucose lipid carrier transferase